jgi:hypothetical protein
MFDWIVSQLSPPVNFSFGAGLFSFQIGDERAPIEQPQAYRGTIAPQEIKRTGLAEYPAWLRYGSPGSLS